MRAHEVLRVSILGLLVGGLALPAQDAWADNWFKRKLEQTAKAAKSAAAALPTGKKKEEASEGQEEAPQDSVVGDVFKGAALCGGITAVTGGSTKNIAIAGAACGAINGTVTALGNRGKKKYAQDYKRISEEMAVTQKEITALEKSEVKNLKKTNQLQKNVEKLVAKEKDDKKFIVQAKGLRKDLDQQMSKVKQSSATADAKIEIIDQQIADMDVIIKDSPDLEDLQNTRIALVAQRTKLVDQVKSANGMNQNLIAQKSHLDDEIIERT